MTRPVILVTGAGGVYGDATVNSLRRADLPLHVLGADVDWHAPGALSSERGIVLPRVDNPDYVEALVDVVRAHGVAMVFVSSGTEIRALAGRRDELESATGATFILPSASLYEMASDKLETTRFLAAAGFDHAPTLDAKDSAELASFVTRVGFPLMAKPRFGQGSRGLALCRSGEDVTRIAMLDEPYVLQQYLGDDDHEYTVGVVATEDGEVLASIALRRWLRGGQTGAAEVVDLPRVTAYAEAIAAKLGPRGYLNVQLRIRDGAPVAFEINARVSSSTGFRTLAGVNEAELIVRRWLLKESPPRPRPQLIAMVRGFSERVVDPAVWGAARPE